jgi:hypothetical protein
MKKNEAKIMSQERSKLIIEYIIQILSDTIKVSASMNFSYSKINGQQMCVLDIYVPERNFEKHLNLGITSDHSLILYEQLLNDFIDTFLEHESIGVTKYRCIKSMDGVFSGIDAFNNTESKIKINFNNTTPEFMDLIKKYIDRYNNYVQLLNEHNQSKSK